MGDIDRQRIRAVRKLQEMGLVWRADGWRNATEQEVLPEADAMHALLVSRADQLDGCNLGSPEEAEYISLVKAIEAYEAKRWPKGKIAGGKG
jgi:predicted nuclease of predicted toxin-antitoxin system